MPSARAHPAPPMNPLSRLLLLVLVLAARGALAADAGIYTIVDGEARVLRGTTWFDLAAGAAVQEGDVVDVREGGLVQAELARGAILNVAGPAGWYAAALPPSGAGEWIFTRGWAKVMATPANPVHLRAPVVEIDLPDGVLVAQLEPAQAGVFVERGRAKITLPAAKGKSMPAGELRDGEFAARAGDRTPTFGDRAPLAFVTAMPRSMRDPLPKLASRYQGKPPALAGGREVTVAEADAWLAGPARPAFVKRLAPRLKDPEFRGAVLARASAYPEWHRALNPEPPAAEDNNRASDGDARREKAP